MTGTFLSTSGILGVVLQLSLFPTLQKRVGTLPLYRLCLGAFPLVPLIMPLANLAARKGLSGEEHEGGFEMDVEPAYKVFVCALGECGLNHPRWHTLSHALLRSGCRHGDEDGRSHGIVSSSMVVGGTGPLL